MQQTCIRVFQAWHSDSRPACTVRHRQASQWALQGLTTKTLTKNQRSRSLCQSNKDKKILDKFLNGHCIKSRSRVKVSTWMLFLMALMAGSIVRGPR
jgi:hypothetical protein